jgi:hypothetical protein
LDIAQVFGKIFVIAVGHNNALVNSKHANAGELQALVFVQVMG